MSGSANIAFDIRSTDNIENDVRATGLPDNIDEIFLFIIYDPVCTEVGTELTSRFRTFRRENPGSECLAQLNCC